MFTDPFSELSVFDKTATVALYLTVAFIVLAAVIGILIRKFRPDNYPEYPKRVMSAASGYAIGILALLMFLKLDEYIADGYIDMPTFLPVVIMLGIMIVAVVAALVIAAFKPEISALFTKIAVAAIGVGILVVIIVSMVNTYKGGIERSVGEEVQLYVYTAILIAVIAALALVFGKKTPALDTRGIVYAAVCIAMSFALSYVRFLELPQGGSITFASLVPLMVFSYMYGIRKGVLAGIIYGFLQFVQAPWFYHPVQFLLDYPIAFCAIGLAAIFHEVGLFKKSRVLQFALGAAAVSVLRYLSHVVSGIFVFGSADPDNYSAVAWSFLYNTFTFADIAIAIVAGSALFASRSFTKLLDSVGAVAAKKSDAESAAKTETKSEEA